MRPLLSALARTRCRHLILMGIAVWLAGCADAQLTYNVVTYDYMVADTANQSILLNAVRASQHYPMSFTSVGPILATPPLSGILAGTFNFGNPAVTGGTTTPTLNVGGGYQTFTLDNLNYQGFMEALREPVSLKIVSSFYQNANWPRETIWLIYIQQITPPPALVAFIDSKRKRECPYGSPGRCKPVNDNLQLYRDEGCGDHFDDINKRLRQIKDDPSFYYNTAIKHCSFLRMKILLEEIRLARLDRCMPSPYCVPPIFQFATFRSAQRMIEYLGELIAAQLYIERPYTPDFAFGLSPQLFVPVPLFVVQRGVGPVRPAVVVYHAGSLYSIPEPAFGSPDEARSLQVLDLVLQTVRAATHRDDMPKLPSLGIVTGAK